ncbi:MAG: after-VIT domain-containing protein [Symploca sp. SIO2C1]|nr:after-VIT domain-containing protein [Symploca sp. SIO2C1]
MKLIYVFPTTLLLTSILGTVADLTQAQALPKAPTQITAQNSQRNHPNHAANSPVGGLYVQSEDGQQQVFPLKHTKVDAKIAGNVSQVEVTQTFTNPFEEPLEAVYVFPLTDEAAVSDMEITIGDRIIKGEIKKREEAQQIYEQARRQGRTAGLLEQERANIFTQSLANIKPGEQIDVTIRYSDSLKFESGDYEFVFPMVVGPRYIPGTQIDSSGDTDQVPDASRITPPVLKPGARSGHDIEVTVEIDAGVTVQNLRSPSHQIRTQRRGRTFRVQLGKEDTIPNKDLILRYQVAGKETQTTVLTQADEQGGHFAVYLIPALEYEPEEIVPKDVVFLMDTSGSQKGEPLRQSKELMYRFINGLNPEDTFTIIDFANTATQLSPKPLANTPRNRNQALRYIEALQANGGTQLMNGIEAVMNFPPASEDRLRSVVLLTDGYIGNENQVIAEVQQQLQPGNRLYSFGVGSSVNRFLLNRLAEVGRGAAQIVRHDEPTQEVAEKFFRQINNPVLTNIQVTWEGEGKAPEIYPAALADLFANQPLVLFGRQSERSNGTLRIRGTAAGGSTYEETLRVNFNRGSNNRAIAQLWGRAKIKDLMNQMFSGETKSGVEAVTKTALSYRLLSQYTAFVAVSEEVRVEPDGTTRRVQVPVELPEGVSYEGIFGPEESEDIFSSGGGGNSPRQRIAAPSTRVGAGSRGGGRRGLGDRGPGIGSRGDSSVGNTTPLPPPVYSEQPPLPEPLSESKSPIKVVAIDGLDPTELDKAIASLTQNLQNLDLPAGFNGKVIFELEVRNGRIRRIVLDDQESTIKDIVVIDLIKRSLSRWRVPSSSVSTVTVELRIGN